MKSGLFFIAVFGLLALTALAFSGNAYARTEESTMVPSEYRMVDSPPVRHISEPVLQPADTSRAVKVEIQRNVDHTGSTQVVNPQ